jgi:hypothetical protein
MKGVIKYATVVFVIIQVFLSCTKSTENQNLNVTTPSTPTAPTTPSTPTAPIEQKDLVYILAGGGKIDLWGELYKDLENGTGLNISDSGTKFSLQLPLSYSALALDSKEDLFFSIPGFIIKYDKATKLISKYLSLVGYFKDKQNIDEYPAISWIGFDKDDNLYATSASSRTLIKYDKASKKISSYTVGSSIQGCVIDKNKGIIYMVTKTEVNNRNSVYNLMKYDISKQTDSTSYSELLSDISIFFPFGATNNLAYDPIKNIIFIPSNESGTVYSIDLNLIKPILRLGDVGIANAFFATYNFRSSSGNPFSLFFDSFRSRLFISNRDGNYNKVHWTDIGSKQTIDYIGTNVVANGFVFDINKINGTNRQNLIFGSPGEIVVSSDGILYMTDVRLNLIYKLKTF